MTHNLELKMPQMIFDGATFRITPRSFEGEGTLFKFEMIPSGFEENNDIETGRLFGLKKHISKFLKSKCTPPARSRPGNWPCLCYLLSTHMSNAHARYVLCICFVNGTDVMFV